jgi:hypothetical protein
MSLKEPCGAYPVREGAPCDLVYSPALDSVLRAKPQLVAGPLPAETEHCPSSVGTSNGLD